MDYNLIGFVVFGLFIIVLTLIEPYKEWKVRREIGDPDILCKMGYHDYEPIKNKKFNFIKRKCNNCNKEEEMYYLFNENPFNTDQNIYVNWQTTKKGKFDE